MPDRHAARQRLALWVGLLTILAWGINFPIQKALLTAMQPAGFLFLRFATMPLMVAALLLVRYGWAWPRLPRRELWALARLGLLGQGLHLALASYGVHWSTPFSSSVLLACGPVFTLLILRAWGTETLQRPQLIGIGVAVSGALLFMSDKLLATDWRASGGDLVLLGAAALFSYYTVAAKPLIERHGALLVFAYATLAASPAVLTYVTPQALQVDWASIGPWLWAGAAWSVMGVGFWSWLSWSWVNAERGVARSAPLIYLMPPIAGAAAWLSTGESFSGIKLLGAAVTLSGVALAQFSARPVPAPSGPPSD